MHADERDQVLDQQIVAAQEAVFNTTTQVVTCTGDPLDADTLAVELEEGPLSDWRQGEMIPVKHWRPYTHVLVYPNHSWLVQLEDPHA